VKGESLILLLLLAAGLFLAYRARPSASVVGQVATSAQPIPLPVQPTPVVGQRWHNDESWDIQKDSNGRTKGIRISRTVTIEG